MSDDIDAADEPVAFLEFHLRAKEGNLVPNRDVSPLSGDSFPLLFLYLELIENSPSLKNPSERS